LLKVPISASPPSTTNYIRQVAPMCTPFNKWFLRSQTAYSIASAILEGSPSWRTHRHTDSHTNHATYIQIYPHPEVFWKFFCPNGW